MAAQAQTRPSDVAWVSELPSAIAVMQKMEAGGPANLRANQSFALHVLIDYIVARSRQTTRDPSKFPIAAQVRIHDYQINVDDLDQQLGGRPPGDETDRRRVLNYFLSPEAVAFYYSLPDAKENVAVSAKGKAFQQAVSQDRALAAAKGVDLSVFGIRLGEPLQLPECGDDSSSAITSALTGIGRGARETCVGGGAGNMALGIASLVTAAAGAPKDPSKKIVSVTLGAANCPDWVKTGGSCIAFVTLQEGIVAGVGFQTGAAGVESTILGKLQEKFKTAPAPNGSFRCSNKYGAFAEEKRYRWEIPGVFATYDALGPDCMHGKVEMQAASYHRLVGAQQAQREASEGKM